MPRQRMRCSPAGSEGRSDSDVPDGAGTRKATTGSVVGQDWRQGLLPVVPGGASYPSVGDIDDLLGDGVDGGEGLAADAVDPFAIEEQAGLADPGTSSHRSSGGRDHLSVSFAIFLHTNSIDMRQPADGRPETVLIPSILTQAASRTGWSRRRCSLSPGYSAPSGYSAGMIQPDSPYETAQ